jgi:hypothetical protein
MNMKKRSYSETGSTSSEASSENSLNFSSQESNKPKISSFKPEVNPSTPLRAVGEKYAFSPLSDSALKFVQQALGTPLGEKTSPEVAGAANPRVFSEIKFNGNNLHRLSFEQVAKKVLFSDTLKVPEDMHTQFPFDELALNVHHLDAKEDFAGMDNLDFDDANSGPKSLLGHYSDSDLAFLDCFNS